ncbi:MAG: outer membrane beta-barrel protein [Lacunisphaera sp.]
MKRCHGLGPLVLLLLLVGAAAPPPVGAAERAAAASSNTARAGQLAADVREFATAPGLSRAKREKRIANAVRTAVVAATAYRSNSADVLGAATELAAAAAHAAPAYVEVIARAAALAPGVARIDGAAGSIRTAAMAGTKGGRAPRVAAGNGRASSSAKAPRVPRQAAPAEPEPHARENSDFAAAPTDTGVGSIVVPMEDEAPLPEMTGYRGRHPVKDAPVAVSLTLDASARRDDNVFLSSTNEVADTIVSAKPGVGLRWGQKSEMHGSIGYAESFEHFMDGTSPNVALGNGIFEFAFDGAASAGSANASYQELYQSNSDLAAQGVNDLIRTDLTAASVSLSANPWAKIGGRLGVNYADTRYRSDGLIGNSQIGVPFDLVFNATPKTDLSLGYVFGTQRPDGGGDSSKDHYFNVGARGQFTAKLAGTFNVGYQTRKVGAHPDEHMLAFNGNFDYELTPRTKMTLGGSRNFNASALGASTKNTSFQLGLTTDLSPQWQLSATASYANNEYGAGVFRPDQVAPQERTDHLWSGTFTASYLFTEWFSTSASYLLRDNGSTIPSVEYSDNVLSLTLGLKY